MQGVCSRRSKQQRAYPLLAGYLLCCLCVCVFMYACALAGRAFCALLAESDTAFEEVYCAAFALLDRVWLARKASYMQFNAVLKEVRAQLEAALQARPRSIQQLQQRLLAS